MLFLKIAGLVAVSVDPDETPYSVVSQLGLHCLLRPVCRNTYGKYYKTFFKQKVMFFWVFFFCCFFLVSPVKHIVGAH